MKIRRTPWNRKHSALFLERIELYAGAGMPIDRALLLAEEGASSQRKASIARVRQSVESGGTLAEALSGELRLSQALVGLISHGESSGDLPLSLAYARSIMERQDELLKKCLSALTYPFAIGAFALVLTIGLMRGVMPQIIPMLKALHAQLPLLTRVVIMFSDGLVSYGAYAFSGFIIISACACFAYARHARSRKAVHTILLKLPLVGKLGRWYVFALFFRSTGMLVDAGMPVSVACARTASVVPLIPLRELLGATTPSLRGGASAGSVFLRLGGGLPSHVPPLVSAGEASGTLGPSMIRAADIIDRDIEHALKRLTSLIEPAMMAGMGCMVGAIALSIMMPIYDISKALQH